MTIYHCELKFLLLNLPGGGWCFVQLSNDPALRRLTYTSQKKHHARHAELVRLGKELETVRHRPDTSDEAREKKHDLLRHLEGDIRQLEKQIRMDILHGADVVCATVSAAGDMLLSQVYPGTAAAVLLLMVQLVARVCFQH